MSSEGVVETNAMHNLVHLLTGSAFRFGGLVLEGKERLTLNFMTAAYFAVALLGFMIVRDICTHYFNPIAGEEVDFPAVDVRQAHAA